MDDFSDLYYLSDKPKQFKPYFNIERKLMFFNSPDDLVVMASAFFTGIGALVFGCAGYYGIKGAIRNMLHPQNVQAVRNKH
ncbi:hypothetical protein OBP_062 [Pseudomonas phage OBP]|uniref:hypothetical protein n=1 Tax=Pseudomonas phage OBP TaxID=1124849 RepID=UPI000240D41C|nr:hypothetical protein OBP_062 [Pseudomonas phage OBP]AEV89499.1 hypothetical protein OBP_062 [Pseudomonas phage OBP]